MLIFRINNLIFRVMYRQLVDRLKSQEIDRDLLSDIQKDVSRILVKYNLLNQSIQNNIEDTNLAIELTGTQNNRCPGQLLIRVLYIYFSNQKDFKYVQGVHELMKIIFVVFHCAYTDDIQV